MAATKITPGLITSIAGVAGGGGFEFVSAVTASASASVTFENMTSTGYDYLLVGSNIKNATKPAA